MVTLPITNHYPYEHKRDTDKDSKMRKHEQPQQPRTQAPTYWSIMTMLLLALLVSLSACQAEAPVTETRLKLAGSTTIEPVARSAAELFMASHPDIDITVRGGGSSIGVKGIAYGALHIGMASRELKEAELEEWPDLTATVIGRDGVAVVINRTLYEAGVTQLTIDQVAGIWRGSITNWQEVGGPDLEILAFDKEMGRGTRDTFAKIVLGDEDESAPGTAGSLGENATVLATISENDGAVSILSTGWQTEDVVGVAIVNSSGQAIAPTAQNVASGQYPITRNLNMITVGPPDGLAAQFIEFVLSSEGQAFVQAHNYTPVSP